MHSLDIKSMIFLDVMRENTPFTFKYMLSHIILHKIIRKNYSYKIAVCGSISVLAIDLLILYH